MHQCTKERSNCVLTLVYTRTDNLWFGRPPRVCRNSVDGPLFAFSKNHDKSTENSFFTHQNIDRSTVMQFGKLS